jgi:uncharacterized protein (AIM24 family)
MYIELQKRKKHVVYINGGSCNSHHEHLEVQSDYGGNFRDKGILEKLKREGKGLAFYTVVDKLKP